MKDDFDMCEADDLLDTIERGYFDFDRPSDQVIADLMKVARLCMRIREPIGKPI